MTLVFARMPRCRNVAQYQSCLVPFSLELWRLSSQRAFCLRRYPRRLRFVLHCTISSVCGSQLAVTATRDNTSWARMENAGYGASIAFERANGLCTVATRSSLDSIRKRAARRSSQLYASSDTGTTRSLMSVTRMAAARSGRSDGSRQSREPTVLLQDNFRAKGRKWCYFPSGVETSVPAGGVNSNIDAGTGSRV